MIQTGHGTISQLSLTDVYHRLRECHGPQKWWPADTPFEVMVGAILVQRTTWTNASRAIDNLKSVGKLSSRAIRETGDEELQEIIRPTGFFRTKSRKLRALSEFLGERYGDSFEAMSKRPDGELRDELLSIYGVGDETADDIMLYAFGRPSFVVDAYARRVFGRLGLVNPKLKYADIQSVFQDGIPRDVALYSEYHALIVMHGKDVCKTRPVCSGCPLDSVCPKIGV